MTAYLLTVHTVEGRDNYLSPDEMQAAFQDVAAYNAKLVEHGRWVFGGGLEPVDTATVVHATRDGDVTTTDGPFAEAKEHIGGFWVVRADDLADAQRWAAEASVACRQPVEVRPFQPDTEE